jgi:hypothetical protein
MTSSSYIVSKDALYNGVKRALLDRNADNIRYRTLGGNVDDMEHNCASYAVRVLYYMGIQPLNFGWWQRTPENLRLLLRDYYKPDGKKVKKKS